MSVGSPSKLSEPVVLSHVKRSLFPEREASDSYAVVDTQFTMESWREDEPVDAATRDALSPFNHVRVGSGYPDLVGVGPLDDSLVTGATGESETPLVAVEAKGYRGDGHVDVERGVVQAHDRLTDANVAYLAAPTGAITTGTQMLARDLNVGVLGVSPEGSVTPLEVPHVVGAQSTSATTALRFQATAQGVADQSFSLNHPKNYLAYPLAVYLQNPTDDLLATHVVGATDGARKGAAFLGLVEETAGKPDPELTPLGAEVVRFAKREYGDVRDALESFAEYKRSRKRFIDVAPKWGQLARQIVYEYPATTLLVTELQGLHEAGNVRPSLRELVEDVYDRHPSFAVELFVSSRDEARSRVLRDDGTVDRATLADGSVYQSGTTFQLKAMLYHAGIVTERGTEPGNLDPETDVWTLVNPL
ncbi:hypothetical protein [Haloarchaeobius sp. HME9146]|uniref:hypothetical protein n=1 Tax=Haloarchaeobius sp. HME9146 TaxID=2978732 RepID=UPI0021BEB6A0|nr:hypothetical protein [Haloarchaeobius sp. HME9146]MCT9097356.1 hypothetical protein [Haloarchaeobius sp. HME9146]